MFEEIRGELRAGFGSITDRLSTVQAEISTVHDQLGAIESRLDAMDLRVSDEGSSGDRVANRLARVDVTARAALEAGEEAASEVERLARRLSRLERGEG